MNAEDVIPLVIMLVVGVVGLSIWIGLIVLGVNIAKRKNRSPHWMWFGIHPMGLLIVLIVMAALPPLRRCPNCGQASSQSARLCGFCGYDFAQAMLYAPPQGAYIPPQRY